MPEGRIIKGVGSFYYVRDENGCVTECKARGVFKNQALTPVVGDNVVFSDEQRLITQILPRMNLLERPVVSNVSLGVIVCTIKSPQISYVTLDKMLINNKKNGLKSLICLNKTDLYTGEEIYAFKSYYEKCGCGIVCVSAKNAENTEELKRLLTVNGLSVFYGVSGCGKSSLMSAVTGDDSYASGGLSRKNQRGKNTTRHTQLAAIGREAYIVDTPGFSSFELAGICCEDLWKYYNDFYDYSSCKYSTCVHINEPLCGVKAAVADNKLNRLRYDNYVRIYEELKKRNNFGNK